jgi:hypothetical protein
VRLCLRTQDGSGLIEFIRQRHTERFFKPIQLLGSAAKNDQGYGFAIMALCSLLVEAIQSYRDGLPTVTERSNAATEERLKSGHAVGGVSIV